MRLRGLALVLVLFSPVAPAQPLREVSDPALQPGLRPLTPRSLRYRIDAQLYPERRTIAGRLELALRNTSSKTLRRACLHLYLNAFAHKDTFFMRDSGGTMRFSRADPSQPGAIKVRELRQAGQPVRSWLALDGTVLEAELPAGVAPGEELRLELAFESLLPRIFARTGQAGEFVMAAQWYPKPGVLRADGSWECAPFHARAEFFAEFGSYELRLRVPARYRVGSTGIVAGERERDGTRELDLRAADVHDFAWAAWPHFVSRSRNIDGVAVELLSVPGRGQADRVLGLIDEALLRLQRWLGRYPYRRLTVVDVPTQALGAAGMEYPTFFTTWSPWFAMSSVRAPDETTVHELIHQYFQGIVASNEAEDPWLDEGVTNYVTGLLLDEIFGADRSLVGLGPLRFGLREKERLRITEPRPDVKPVGWPARRFDSWYQYGRTVYARGTLLLRTIESLIGRDAVRAALAEYVQAFAFRHPTSTDLERALVGRAPGERRATVIALLDGALRRAADLDYHLSCRPGEVRIERRGALAVPLELELSDASGVRPVRLDGAAPEQRIRADGLRAARLGPPSRLALDHTPADHACELSPVPRRATLGWATALQPLLQVLGP